MKPDRAHREESFSVGRAVGAAYVVLGILILWWIVAPQETINTVFIDTPTRVAQTAGFFRAAAIRSHEHPNSWKVQDYPLVQHGVIDAEPAMLGLDSTRSVSLQLQVGREYRLIDSLASTEIPAAADTTYLIDPAAEKPLQQPLLKVEHWWPPDLTQAALEGLAGIDRHLVVITTSTASMLQSAPVVEWLAWHGVDPTFFEGPSRPALVIVPQESSVPGIPYVIAPPNGFIFRF